MKIGYHILFNHDHAYQNIEAYIGYHYQVSEAPFNNILDISHV